MWIACAGYQIWTFKLSRKNSKRDDGVEGSTWQSIYSEYLQRGHFEHFVLFDNFFNILKVNQF